MILQCVESLKNGKYVLESPWKVLEFLVQKRVRTLILKSKTKKQNLVEISM